MKIQIIKWHMMDLIKHGIETARQYIVATSCRPIGTLLSRDTSKSVSSSGNLARSQLIRSLVKA